MSISMRLHTLVTTEVEEMSEKKHILEFYPGVIFMIPKTAGGSCCLKPMAKQTERSREMYRFARHLQWENRDNIDFLIPSKSESRVRAFIKWKKFKTKVRMWRLGIKKLPALVLDGRVMCQGFLDTDNLRGNFPNILQT